MFKVPYLLPYFLKNIRLSSFLQLIVVKELETASPQRRDQIMEETYKERREWVTQGKKSGPSIKQVMKTYPIFHTDIDQVRTTLHQF